jgi:hypothetical protein
VTDGADRSKLDVEPEFAFDPGNELLVGLGALLDPVLVGFAATRV